MQISLRSHLIAGTAAVVGAGAVAMTPVVTPDLNLSALRTDAVSMTSFANPIAALLENVDQTVDYLLNSTTILSGTGATNWPNAGIGDANNAALATPELGGYVNVGIIPQILSDSFPIVTQIVNNQIGYLTLLADLGIAVGGAAAGLAWLPVDLGVSIFNDIITGDFDQILPDITAAITTAFDTVVSVFELAIAIPVEIVTAIATRAFAVVETVFELVPTLVQSVIGQGTAFLGAGQAAVEGIFAAISTGNLETIWNATVAGLLSPVGVPGVINNLTFGAGIANPEFITAENPFGFVPSTRTLVQAGVKAVATAVGTTPPPAAAVEAPVAASAVAEVEAAAVVEDEVAPVVEDEVAPVADDAEVEAALAEVEAEVAAEEAAAEEAAAEEAPAAEAGDADEAAPAAADEPAAADDDAAE